VSVAIGTVVTMGALGVGVLVEGLHAEITKGMTSAQTPSIVLAMPTRLDVI
jgi:hypothetical protein